MSITELSILLLYTLSALSAVILIVRLYLHISRGQTKELKGLVLSMIFLLIAIVISALDSIPLIHNGVLSMIFSKFNIAWYIQRVFFLVSFILLIRWAWHYITLRLLPQFYLTVTAIGLTAFVLTTITLTAVMFRQAEEQALRSLEADVRTFALTLSELKDRTALISSAIASRDALLSAAESSDGSTTADALGDPVGDFGLSATYVINAGGEVITSTGAESIVGQSFADDPIVAQVLTGKILSSPILQKDIETPSVIIRAGSPLVKDGEVIGAVIVDTPLDIAFVDRIGTVTGLDVIIYANEHRVATTLRDSNGQPLVAATIEDEQLKDIVLQQGKIFRSSSILNSRPYFIAALPIKNSNEENIGVLAAGIPAQDLVDSLATSTKTSFLATFILLILSLIPFHYIARFLTRDSGNTTS
jgi:hypothetical protein